MLEHLEAEVRVLHPFVASAPLRDRSQNQLFRLVSSSAGWAVVASEEVADRSRCHCLLAHWRRAVFYGLGWLQPALLMTDSVQPPRLSSGALQVFVVEADAVRVVFAVGYSEVQVQLREVLA